MTGPLMALAVGAMVAGFIGIPAALGGTNAIEHFLEPSFTASAAASPGAHPQVAATDTTHEEVHLSRTAELGLMLFSVLIGAAGIFAARHMYVTSPAMSARLAAQWPGVHALLFNKYYVDELYDATAIRGTLAAARGLFGFDRVVVDGAVNGSGALTRISAWFSHMADKYVVDGAVNLVGWTTGEGSLFLRRLQTGLVQNYAFLMLVGVFLFLTLFLIAR
jgi:NADH-quinone oxidoreductase subunit L